MQNLIYAYNTSGFSNHRLDDCLALLAELGYGGVSITPDVAHLDPLRWSATELRRTEALLKKLKLRAVVETGARFVLDPRRKHWPTLVSARAEDRTRRLEFLERCAEIAAQIGAEGISLWSGVKDPELPEEDAWDALIEAVESLLETASERGLFLAFEPEPGMFIENMAQFSRLMEEVGDARLGLTLDVGHVACTEKDSISKVIQRWSDRLRNLHIEDIRGRVHQHLPLGEGDLSFGPILQALRRVEYAGLVSVELGRDGHRAPELARASLAFLKEHERA